MTLNAFSSWSMNYRKWQWGKGILQGFWVWKDSTVKGSLHTPIAGVPTCFLSLLMSTAYQAAQSKVPAQRCSSAIMAIAVIPQRSYGLWRSLCGKGPFVSLPRGQPQQTPWVTLYLNQLYSWCKVAQISSGGSGLGRGLFPAQIYPPPHSISSWCLGMLVRYVLHIQFAKCYTRIARPASQPCIKLY